MGSSRAGRDPPSIGSHRDAAHVPGAPLPAEAAFGQHTCSFSTAKATLPREFSSSPSSSRSPTLQVLCANFFMSSTPGGTGDRMGAAAAIPPLADPAPGQAAETNW